MIMMHTKTVVRLFGLVLVGVVLVAGAVLAKEIKVPDEFKTIQEALNTAEPGDVILIAGGDYTENLLITKSVTLQGAAGRDFVSVIGNGVVPTVVISKAQNVVISGVTVTNGRNGIEMADSSLTLSNVVLKKNIRRGLSAERSVVEIKDSEVLETQPDAEGFQGSGIRVTDHSKVTITNVTVSDNARVGVTVSDSSEATITSSRVLGTKPNASGAYGWGIDVSVNSKATIRENTVSGNTAVGIGIGENSQAVIESNQITDQKPDGSGIRGYGILIQLGSKAEIRNNTLTKNTDKAILATERTEVLINGNQVTDTQPTAFGFRGRGIEVGFLSKATVTNNTLTNNLNVGIYILDTSEATVENNTITGMRNAPESPYAVGIQFDYKVKGIISNNTLDNNAVYYVIAVFGCPDEVKVTNNKISNGKPSADGFGARGIQVQDSQAVAVNGNTITDMGDVGIRFLRSQGQIMGNTVLRATWMGILVTNSKGTIEKNGVISETQLDPNSTNGVGIQVDSGADFSITENTITKNRRGIVIAGQNTRARIDKNVIDSNNIRGSGTGALGIAVFDRAQAEVTNNQITNNGTGILTDQTGQVTKCTGNTFSGNQLNTQGNARCS
ncbi:right-handed parallel beta-helix repeat-containing protein [Candidatus Acetothermia bacterium]|jgi:parallel beta-helix repeat protein|nr:right-handed parallel beta-helix repeat-containing protein [Candidatus Acetothermia bacterium]